jgi:hypothetical protein
VGKIPPQAVQRGKSTDIGSVNLSQRNSKADFRGEAQPRAIKCCWIREGVFNFLDQSVLDLKMSTHDEGQRVIHS